MPLLITKLCIPTPCPKLVPRSHLLGRLDDGLKLGHKLTLVSAPAGFGKTNLLSEWGKSTDILKSVAWLSLEEGDNRPTRFWLYVIAALQTVLDEVGETTAALLGSRDALPIEELLTPLLNEIAAQPGLVVLILDDYHLISIDEIHGGITFLVDHSPSQLHLVIATRADPPLPIVRLRARSQLTELRGDDLRFTYDETISFLNSKMGLALAESDVKALDRRIEGWIAGLNLAAISMREQVNKHDFILSFIGSNYYILEYLIEEVIRRLPKDVLHFLTQTSILTQLNTSLCNRVTGRTDSAMMLARLYHENLFVTALDYEHNWYRYHRLFADLLKSRLQQKLDKQAVAGLHQLASSWYEEQGYLQMAVQHAQGAGDMARVADLAEQAAQSSLIDSWMTDLLGWLELLPESFLRSRLRLRIYQAFAYFFDGQSVRCMNLLEEIEQAIQELAPSPENRALMEELSRLVEVVYGFNDLLVHSLQGKFDQSSQILQRIQPMVEEAGNVFMSAHILEGLALIQYHQGKLWAAASTCEQLIELAGGSLRGFHLSQPLPIATSGYLLLASIYLDQNRLEEMEQLLTRAFAICRKSGGAKSLVEMHVMNSRLQQAQGDFDGAYQSIVKAERAYSLKGLMTRFRLESQKARLKVETGELDEVFQWITGLRKVDAWEKSNMPFPFLFYEVVQLILARVYLAKHQPEKALLVLEQIRDPAEKEGRNRHVVEIYTLKALAFQVTKQYQAAVEQFERALKLAEPEAYKRVFLDCNFLGRGAPMQQLLYKAVEGGIMPAFAKELLSAFPQVEKDVQIPGEKLLEPLSKREVEVLEFLSKGLSNRLIAQQMVISLDTVKTHTGNIYSKLGVNNRTQAVLKGKELGLIE